MISFPTSSVRQLCLLLLWQSRAIHFPILRHFLNHFVRSIIHVVVVAIGNLITILDIFLIAIVNLIIAILDIIVNLNLITTLDIVV
jgi:hypothetical protein